ncbi:MAG: hypothetical protein HKM95_09300 [Inquilinus sp.]|nr:hypothetical protein [Inquilinus sp.]
MSLDLALNQISSLLGRSDFVYSVDRIDEAFMNILLNAEGKKWGNPEFDYSLHDLNEKNSFWIGCRDENGDTIATVAARRLETASFIEECRSYQLWYGSKIRFTEPLSIVLRKFDRVPSGSIVLVGAGWVRPDHRGLGLSWALTRLAHYLAMRMWHPRWLFGITLTGIFQSAVPIINFGFPQVDYFASGYRLPGLSAQDIYLLTMTRQEAIELAVDDSQFLAERPHLHLDRTFGQELKAERRKVAPTPAAAQPLGMTG